MRISTNTIFDLGVSSIQQRLSDLVKTQQQISTGRRILTPEDDPAGSARALGLSQTLGVTQQYKTNVGQAASQLSIEESVLGNITQTIQNARVVIVNAGNPTIGAANLAAFATELRGRYQELLGQANSKDAQGQYLFAGFKSNTAPFTQTTGPGVYVGDQGQRAIQIAANREITIADHGQDVFKPGVANQDVFETLDTFITQLQSGSVTSAQISTALNNLDNSLNNILRIRSSVGARLKELENAANAHDDTALQYESAISDIRDLDFTKAITDLTRYQTSLEAAQKSFLSIQDLSLFKLI